MELQWEPFAAEGVAAQALRRSDDAFGGEEIAAFQGNALGCWRDEDVEKGYRYRYRLAGRDTSGEEIVSSNQLIIDVGSPYFPPAPEVTVPEQGFTYLKLAWEKPPSLVRKYILRRFRGTDQLERLVTIPASDPFFCDEGLQPGTDYRYELFAFTDYDAVSSTGAEAEGKTLPLPPTGLEVAGRGFTWIRLDWEPLPDGELSLRLERDGVELDVGLMEPGSYLDGDLAPGCTYTYRGGFFWGRGTDWDEGAVTAETLAPPGDLEAVPLEGPQVRLAWSPVESEEVVGQWVYRSTEGEDVFAVAAELAPEQGVWIDEDVRGGRTYSYKLRLRDSGGGEAWTEPEAISLPEDDPDDQGEPDEPVEPADPGSGDGDDSDPAGDEDEDDGGRRPRRPRRDSTGEPMRILVPTLADLEFRGGGALLLLAGLERGVSFTGELLAALAAGERELLVSCRELDMRLDPSRLTDPEGSAFTIRSGDMPLQLPGGYNGVSRVYGITTQGETDAGLRLDLCFHYDSFPVSPSEEVGLGVYRYDPGTGRWQYVGGRLDRTRQQIWVQGAPPGDYAVLSCFYTYEDLEGHWARPWVEALAARHLWPHGEDFRPQEPLRRGEFTGWLVRALALPLPGKTGGGRVFADVEPGDSFATAIAAARERGLVAGRPGGVFQPRGVMSRQEMAHLVGQVLLRDVILVGGERPVLAPARECFTDWEQVEDWAQAGTGAAAAAGLLVGREAGVLAPGEPATRAEGAVLLARLLELMEGLSL